MPFPPIAISPSVLDNCKALTTNQLIVLLSSFFGHCFGREIQPDSDETSAYGVVQADLCVFKPERFTFAPEETLFERAWKEIEKLQPLDESVKVEDELKFSNDNVDDKVIHIILALSEDALAGQPTGSENKARKRPRTAGRPTTPENKLPPAKMPSPPRKGDSIMQIEVERLLDRFDDRLEKYLSDLPWADYWVAPESADVPAAEFLSGCKIPRDVDSGAPILLLHDLECDVVDKEALNELFNTKSRFLVNTSGSGKTRLMLEGLCRHWGFYLTVVTSVQNNWLGSMDLMTAIEEGIPDSVGFTSDPTDLDQDAFRRNDRIAERRILQIIRARLFIFERFLWKAKTAFPNRPIAEFKKHWLFLQLNSVKVLDLDIFSELTQLLYDASDHYLLKGFRKVHSILKGLQMEFNLDEKFFFILDEAQEAIKRLGRSFRSQKDASVRRPVLRPIVATFITASGFPIIISGTGLSMDVVDGITVSAALKHEPFHLATRTGSFDKKEAQHKYILRYMPPHIARSEAGKELLERAWTYARGRPRFTASLVTQLILTSFQSPHKVLNAFIKLACGFIASDGQPFVAGEKDIELQERSTPLDLSKIVTGDSQRVNLFADIIHTWLMRRRLLPLDNKEKDLVELGLARFIDSPDQKLVIDEPLVVLGAAQQFSIAHSLQDHLKNRLRHAAGRGENFEDFIGYYLASSFGKMDLCDMFDFRGDVPQWAKQGAQLISVTRNGEKLDINPYNFQKFFGASTVIGYQSKSDADTVEWCKDPQGLMCFPDVWMGPDIIFFIRLDSGEIIAVVVQCKWKSQETLPNGVLAQAISTVDPLKFWKHDNLKDPKWKENREAVMESFKRVSELGTEVKEDKWLKDGPVLRVVVPFPAEAPERDLKGCVLLNMDRCQKLVDQRGLLQSVASSLGVKRPAEDSSDDKTVKKLR